MERGKMIETIYDAQHNKYPDIRQYKNEKEILQRRLDIQKILSRFPYNQRNTRKERHLRRELLFLKYKYMLYTDSKELPMDALKMTVFLMESTDRMSGDDGEGEMEETPEQSERFKRCQTTTLLHLMHLKSTDEEFMNFYQNVMSSSSSSS